jgi:hypothetical protein
MLPKLSVRMRPGIKMHTTQQLDAKTFSETHIDDFAFGAAPWAAT